MELSRAQEAFRSQLELHGPEAIELASYMAAWHCVKAFCTAKDLVEWLGRPCGHLFLARNWPKP